MKGTGKRFLSALLALVMVMSLLPVSVFAAEGDYDYTYGATVKVTDDAAAPSGSIPPSSEWELVSQETKVDLTKCPGTLGQEHTHSEDCYYKSCDHKDGHLSTCYSESTSYALCEHEDASQHTGSVTLADVVTISGTSATWKTEHPAYEVVYAVYKAAYDEAYASAKYLKDAAGKTAGVAALVGKTFCYTVSTSAEPDLCDHVCSEVGGSCYTKTCLLAEHSAHTEDCYTTTYTWYLKDTRPATEIVAAEDVTITYNADASVMEADLWAALVPTVVDENGDVVAEGDAITLSYTGELTAGEHTVTLSYAGSEYYASCTVEVTVTVNKAPVAVSINSNLVKYGEDYEIVATTDPAGVDTIQFVVGLNVSDMHLENEEVTGWTTELNLMLPDEAAQILARFGLEEGVEFSASDLKGLLTNEIVSGLLVKANVSQETLDALVNTLDELTQEFGDLKISVGAPKPTDIGVYLVGAITSNPNYETKTAVGYLAITPDGYKAELDWVVEDENGIITLPVIQDGSYDLSAYVTKVYEGTVEEAEKELVNLFLGVDVDGNLVVTKDQTELVAGAYTEISYILNWGNTMYYAQPIARAFVVAPQLVDVKFVDENGNVNNDRLFTFDGQPHAMAVAVNGTVTVPGNGLTVTYYGVRSNGELYNSTETPVHAGTYTAMAVYAQRNAAGNVTAMGMDVGAMVIQPAKAIIAVDNGHHIYNGQPYDVMQLVKSTPADAKVALFTCGIDLEGDFSEAGLSALGSQANIDFPAAADKVLE